MRKRQREAILISFLKETYKYEKLAEYIIHLIKDDPASPKESFYTVTYRIKEKARLIEKIDDENKSMKADEVSITQKNFQEKIGDLLGIRVICLRLSDINRIKAYLELLADEKIFRFIRKPDHKKSFVLPIDPDETIPEGLDLRYSGYSSIHYQIALGSNSDATEDLKGLQVELQLRTILEEAWGEIDHKYRYVFSRSGSVLPDYIHTGFYNLSAYLQAAALQAEYLCRQSEAHRSMIMKKKKGTEPIESLGRPIIPEAFLLMLDKTFGFRPTVRTQTYIIKRFDESGYVDPPQVVFQKIITKEMLLEFKTIFHKILNREAFKDKMERNVDVINAINFGLSDKAQGKRVAKEGLRSILKWKKERSMN